MSKTKFWTDDPLELLNFRQGFPLASVGATSIEKMNALSRLFVLIFAGLCLTGVGMGAAIAFLIGGLGSVTILAHGNVENYVNFNISGLNKMNVKKSQSAQVAERGLAWSRAARAPTAPTVQPYTYYSTQIQTPYETEAGPHFQSKNQALTNGVGARANGAPMPTCNPKTLIPPVLVAPMYDWNYWGGSSLSVPSAINSRSMQDYAGSGYQTTGREAPTVSGGDYYRPTYKNVGGYGEPATEEWDPRGGSDGISTYTGLVENYTPAYGAGENDAVLGSDDPGRLEVGLPANYGAVGTGVPSLNDSIFTSTVAPGLYYKNDVVEPVSSNIGISWTQQIPPTIQNGSVWEAVDPNLVPGPYSNEYGPPRTGRAEYEVYDPRQTGYGSAVRAYVDEMSGQPRYVYDDVDAIRRPNYISRSNVDFLEQTDTYGPMNSNQQILHNNANARQSAEAAYLKNQTGFRNDMMMSLRRKNIAREWQQKIAPLSRAGQFTRGGGMVSGKRGNLVAR